MAFQPEHLYQFDVIYLEDEPAGGTYLIDDHPVCLNVTTSEGNIGMLCSNLAGRGTDHPRAGKCSFHGGSHVPDKSNFKHVNHRYSHATKNHLRRSIEEIEKDSNFGDLTPELLLLRGMLHMYIEENPQIQVGHIGIIRTLIADIASLTERIDRIESRHVLTLSSVRMMMARGVDIASRFLTGSELVEFVSGWRAEVQGPLEPTQSYANPGLIDNPENATKMKSLMEIGD